MEAAILPLSKQSWSSPLHLSRVTQFYGSYMYLYGRGFQPGVRVPLGVREGLSGGTRAPFYLLKKKSFITLLPVTVLWVRVHCRWDAGATLTLNLLGLVDAIDVWMPICLNKYFSEKLCFVLGGYASATVYTKGVRGWKKVENPCSLVSPLSRSG